MICYRARHYGTSAWAYLIVQGEEDSTLPETLAAIVGSALSTSSLHVQKQGEDGDWEDLE